MIPIKNLDGQKSWRAIDRPCVIRREKRKERTKKKISLFPCEYKSRPCRRLACYFDISICYLQKVRPELMRSIAQVAGERERERLRRTEEREIHICMFYIYTYIR